MIVMSATLLIKVMKVRRCNRAEVDKTVINFALLPSKWWRLRIAITLRDTAIRRERKLQNKNEFVDLG